MKTEEILNTKVTYQNNYWTDLIETDLRTIFNEIRGSRHIAYTQELSKLYSSGDIEMYSVKKKSLPVATFSGTFSKVRSKIGLDTYNYLVVLDVDKLSSEDLESTRRVFKDDQHVICFWKSPSQNGIKALVKIEYNKMIDSSAIDLYHKHGFNEISEYFYNHYKIELDKSGSDFTRLCFISCDPDFFIKENFVNFNVDLTNLSSPKEDKARVMAIIQKPTQTIKAQLYNASGKNQPQNKKAIQNIIAYLSKNSKSITFHYDDWLRVAFAIANSFTFDIGIKYFKELSKNDSSKFDAIQCENILIDCYQNSRNLINFVTIIHLAKNQGFVANRTNRKST